MTQLANIRPSQILPSQNVGLPSSLNSNTLNGLNVGNVVPTDVSLKSIQDLLPEEAKENLPNEIKRNFKRDLVPEEVQKTDNSKNPSFDTFKAFTTLEKTQPKELLSGCNEYYMKTLGNDYSTFARISYELESKTTEFLSKHPEDKYNVTLFKNDPEYIKSIEELEKERRQIDEDFLKKSTQIIKDENLIYNEEGIPSVYNPPSEAMHEAIQARDIAIDQNDAKFEEAFRAMLKRSVENPNSNLSKLLQDAVDDAVINDNTVITSFAMHKVGKDEMYLVAFKDVKGTGEEIFHSQIMPHMAFRIDAKGNVTPEKKLLFRASSAARNDPAHFTVYNLQLPSNLWMQPADPKLSYDALPLEDGISISSEKPGEPVTYNDIVNSKFGFPAPSPSVVKNMPVQGKPAYLNYGGAQESLPEKQPAESSIKERFKVLTEEAKQGHGLYDACGKYSREFEGAEPKALNARALEVITNSEAFIRAHEKDTHKVIFNQEDKEAYTNSMSALLAQRKKILDLYNPQIEARKAQLHAQHIPTLNKYGECEGVDYDDSQLKELKELKQNALDAIDAHRTEQFKLMIDIAQDDSDSNFHTLLQDLVNDAYSKGKKIIAFALHTLSPTESYLIAFEDVAGTEQETHHLSVLPYAGFAINAEGEVSPLNQILFRAASVPKNEDVLYPTFDSKLPSAFYLNPLHTTEYFSLKNSMTFYSQENGYRITSKDIQNTPYGIEAPKPSITQNVQPVKNDPSHIIGNHPIPIGTYPVVPDKDRIDYFPNLATTNPSTSKRKSAFEDIQSALSDPSDFSDLKSILENADPNGNIRDVLSKLTPEQLVEFNQDFLKQQYSNATETFKKLLLDEFVPYSKIQMASVALLTIFAALAIGGGCGYVAGKKSNNAQPSDLQLANGIIEAVIQKCPSSNNLPETVRSFQNMLSNCSTMGRKHLEECYKIAQNPSSTTQEILSYFISNKNTSTTPANNALQANDLAQDRSATQPLLNQTPSKVASSTSDPNSTVLQVNELSLNNQIQSLLNQPQSDLKKKAPSNNIDVEGQLFPERNQDPKTLANRRQNEGAKKNVGCSIL